MSESKSKKELTLDEILELPTKEAIDELMKLYDNQPSLIIYSGDLLEGAEET